MALHVAVWKKEDDDDDDVEATNMHTHLCICVCIRMNGNVWNVCVCASLYFTPL